MDHLKKLINIFFQYKKKIVDNTGTLNKYDMFLELTKQSYIKTKVTTLIHVYFFKKWIQWIYS